MAIRVGGRPGLGTLGEQVLLLGRTHIVGQAGRPRAVNIPGRLTPGNITPSRPDWVKPGRTCPGISVRTSTPSSLPKDVLSGMSLRQLGRFAALPPSFYRQEHGGNVGAYADRPLAEGPHFWVGPFLLPANQDGPLDIHVPISKMRSREDFRAFGQWAVNKVWDYTYKRQGWGATGPMPYKKDGKMWAANSGYLPGYGGDRCLPAGVCIPDNQYWGRGFIDGRAPIAKFDHPTKKRSGGGAESWAVFLTISGENEDKQYPAAHFKFTFKKVDPGFWSSLWDWLVKIVTKVINTVVDLLKSMIEGLLAYACQLATPILQQLEIAAKSNTVLPAGVVNEITMRTNISGGDIDKAMAAATGAGVKGIGEAIIKGFCGGTAPASPPMKTTEEAGGVSAGLVVAGLGAAGILAYFLLR